MGKESEVLKNVLSLDIFLINRALPCDINITHYYTVIINYDFIYI